jgi:hypothetical protein
MTIPPCDLPEFVWIWNNRLGQETPAHHRRIARWLAARDAAAERRLLLMAFRGAGKSTLVGLWCAWRLLRRPDTRILVLAADQPLAVKMVAQVRRIIERHPLCRHLRPNTPEAWAADRFTVRRPGVLRDPSVLAAGIGGNITGARAPTSSSATTSKSPATATPRRSARNCASAWRKPSSCWCRAGRCCSSARRTRPKACIARPPKAAPSCAAIIGW